MPGLVHRLLDEDGQTLIEYALLAALVALVSVGALRKSAALLHTAYTGWGIALDSLWDMPPPGSK